MARQNFLLGLWAQADLRPCPHASGYFRKRRHLNRFRLSTRKRKNGGNMIAPGVEHAHCWVIWNLSIDSTHNTYANLVPVKNSSALFHNCGSLRNVVSLFELKWSSQQKEWLNSSQNANVNPIWTYDKVELRPTSLILSVNVYHCNIRLKACY